MKSAYGDVRNPRMIAIDKPSTACAKCSCILYSEPNHAAANTYNLMSVEHNSMVSPPYPGRAGHDDACEYVGSYRAMCRADIMACNVQSIQLDMTEGARRTRKPIHFTNAGYDSLPSL